MKLKCLSSGSIGNCYLLECNNEILILDCGISIKDIKVGLNFDLSKVVGCVITHSHKDHSLSAETLKNMGIKVWQPYLTQTETNKVQKEDFGNFWVRSFDVPHDGVPCCGFIIQHMFDKGKLLYATDFEYIKYSFKVVKINHLLIECNYQKEFLDSLADNRKHVLRGHAELQTTIGIIEDNRNSLKNVILCHLSQDNAIPCICVSEAKLSVNPGVYVDYARKGFEVELRTDKCPF